MEADSHCATSLWVPMDLGVLANCSQLYTCLPALLRVTVCCHILSLFPWQGSGSGCLTVSLSPCLHRVKFWLLGTL